MAEIQVTELNISEDEADQFAAQVQLSSPFCALGLAEVQAYNSPLENVRLESLPRSDAQFTFSESDTGVLKDE